MKQLRLIKSIILLVLIGIITAGCTDDTLEPTETTDDSILTIYSTVYPIQFAIEKIGGDTVNAKTVYPPGVDAHSYEPTSKEMTTIAKADAFIYLGAGMEAFAETAADALENQELALIEIGEHKELFHMEEDDEHEEDHHEHNHGDNDPHIWIDPERMLKMSEIIKDELVSLNPESEALYNENFTSLKEELIALDNKFTEILKTKSKKEILVAHAAYGYWEERYGIQQIAISGLSSSSEPSQKELTEIIDQAKNHNLTYIIFEQNSSNRVSEIIQSEIGAEALTIHNLAVLTDKDISNDEDYFSLMEENMTVLDQATE
ncbi:metal ABC transporter solute-binding protein, Zn/Mn family [Oceanobacillus halophilus]|uniref:Adhesin n=1 Tax=Oceanobacillus halophilus TaxID=930130 RepID=A0A495A6L0_9BACI|nr:zinc ABC transporter substrate-binding protein [Oceanobacillus halophilus]RKQ35492.1 adhesin [Oceanobacillus halophilus]